MGLIITIVVHILKKLPVFFHTGLETILLYLRNQMR